MIRIICAECKNAYLREEGDKLVCPSCEATYTENKKNLLLGIQYYREGNFSEADNCFMKYIVKNGTEPFALFYKALCDAQNLDEDTLSLKDTYKKIFDAFKDVSDKDFPELIALANDETEKAEKALTEIHVRLFADADAEKIKKQVETILNIQREAKAFRTALNDLVLAFNERSPRKLSVKFSDCFFVESDIATEVGNIKYQKICDNIATHTVFTGVLTNDIKSLEIYFRCVVMFFRKSHDKYEFLLEQSKKFVQLAEKLELGQYNTIKGIGAVADKLKAVSYDFLEESCKEHFDEKIEMQTETVVIIEPETVEEENDSQVEIPQEENVTTENTEEDTPAEATEENIIVDTDIIEIEVEEAVEETTEKEIEDISSTTENEVVTEESNEDATEENDEAVVENSVDSEEEATIEETTETEDEAEEADDAVIEIPVDSTEETTEPVEESDSDSPVVTEEAPLDNFEKIEADDAVINGDDQKHKVTNPKKKNGKKALVLVVLIVVLSGLLAGYKYGPELINKHKYDKASILAQEGNYSEAVTAFKALGEYSDSAQKATECEYNYAAKLEEEGKFAEAKAIFENLGDYSDSKTRTQACAYSQAKQALESKNFEEAAKLFISLGDYGDSKEMVKEASYKHALHLMENKEYKSAIEILTTIRKYSDSKDKILEAKYMYVTDNFDKKNKTTVKYLNELTTAQYRNSADLRKELLGSAEVMSDDIKAFVNYSATDLETSLTQLENTRSIYFHVVVGDKSLYGQTLTLKYTTAFGYSQRKTVTLSESDNVAVMSYPSTPHRNYTVDFELLDSTGKKVAGQQISF